jgi:hypothetical protein
MGNNKIKEKQLKMSFGKANAILRKTIVFNLAQKCNLDICYRCKKKIEIIDDFTIDHKTEWLHSNDPVELFFSFDNIAFSHFNCNRSDRQNKIIKSKLGYKGVSLSGNIKNKYTAFICKNNKKFFVGNFPSLVEAAEAYDKAAIKFWSEKAVTNKSLGLI